MNDPSYLTLGGLGLTPDELAQIPAIQTAKSLVSPWLWVFSLIGFTTGMINYSRIKKMWQKHGNTRYKGLKRPY